MTKTVLTTEEKKVLVGQRETVIDCDLMKHYSVMNYRSALSRELMLELLTCAFPVKYIRCKEEVANFSFQLYYWVAYMAGKRGEMASVTSTAGYQGVSDSSVNEASATTSNQLGNANFSVVTGGCQAVATGL